MMQGINLEALGVVLYLPVWAVAILTLAVGALVGLVNGVLIAVPGSCLCGHAWLAVCRARYRAADDQRPDLQQAFRQRRPGNTGFDWLGFNRIFNVPVGVLILGVTALICGYLLSRTAFGRWLYASGGNERAAELSGVPVKRVKISVYVLSGICAAMAGLVLSSQLTSAGPTAGTTYELTAIAAVVIGGAALTGGRGNVRGTLLGAFVIGFL